MTVAIASKEIIFTSKDAADFLGLDPNTISTYVKRKLLIPIGRAGTSYLFTKPECERFKKSRRPRGNPNFQVSSSKKSKSRRKASKTVA